MKKIAVLSVLCLTVAVILTACKQAVPADTKASQIDGASASQTAVQPSGQAETAAADERSADTPSASGGAGTTKAAASAASADTESQPDAPDSGGKTTAAPDKTDRTTVPGTAQNTTAPGAAQKTTAPGTTQKQPSGSTTKPSAATTKPGSTPSSTTKPSGTPNVTGQPTESTTAGQPSTTKPVPVGNAVSGSLSYLNNAAVTYLPAMNEDDLKAFGITGDKQKEILKNKKDWTVYTIQIDFRNNTDKPLTLYYLDVTDNGKDDIYVCGDTAGELGMTPGGRISEKFYVLAKKEYADIDVHDKLSRMAMRVQYAETPADDSMTPVFLYSKIG